MAGAEAVAAMLAAAAAGDAARVSALLREDASLATARNMFGSQPIHAAHFGGQAAVVDLLRRAGVELDIYINAEIGDIEAVGQALAADPAAVGRFRPGRGDTPLHAACYWGQVAVARLLLEAGADPTVGTRDGFLLISPLGSAVASPDVPNPSDDESTVLALARLLLDAGADVNARRRDGMTALHTAAYRGHLDVIRLLLERGADASIAAHADAGPHGGETARDTALSQGQTAAAALLQRGSGGAKAPDVP